MQLHFDELSRTVAEHSSRSVAEPPGVNLIATGRGPSALLPDRLTSFVGREEDLVTLHAALMAGEDRALHQRALHATGGVGKTAMAIEYAWRFEEEYPGGQFFLSAETDQPQAELAKLAPVLGIEASDDESETALRVKLALERTASPSLLVIDNIHDADSWRRWQEHLPGPPCRRLVTTRAPALPNMAMQELGRLPDEQCVELLAHFRADAADETSREAVLAIVAWVDGWAVAVSLVGAYMQVAPTVTWEGYWADLRGRGLQSLREVQDAAADVRTYDEHIDAVLGDLLGRLRSEERGAARGCRGPAGEQRAAAVAHRTRG